MAGRSAVARTLVNPRAAILRVFHAAAAKPAARRIDAVCRAAEDAVEFQRTVHVRCAHLARRLEVGVEPSYATCRRQVGLGRRQIVRKRNRGMIINVQRAFVDARQLHIAHNSHGCLVARAVEAIVVARRAARVASGEPPLFREVALASLAFRLRRRGLEENDFGIVLSAGGRGT